MPLHANSIKWAVLIPFLFCSASSWATDIQCESTRQPAQRVICDHAILNHEYDDIYEQQQKLLQEGKLTTSGLAAWRHKRDACIDVHCIDGVFAEWSTAEKSLGNRAAAPVITGSETLGITASEALGASPASPASSAAAEASQQSSSVPVARQGSAYGIALPQPVASAASAPAPVSAASAATDTSGRASSNPLLGLLAALLLIAVLSVGAIVIYQRRRRG